MTRKPQVVGSVAAGFPSPAEQYLEPPLDLNELLVKRPAATFFVKVAGDSMTGAGIYDGDLLVVDRSLVPANGDIIVAAVDGEFTVKTLRVLRNNELGIGNSVRYVLEPANPNYPNIEIKRGNQLDCFGVVTSAIHQFKGGVSTIPHSP